MRRRLPLSPLRQLRGLGRRRWRAVSAAHALGLAAQALGLRLQSGPRQQPGSRVVHQHRPYAGLGRHGGRRAIQAQARRAGGASLLCLSLNAGRPRRSTVCCTEPASRLKAALRAPRAASRSQLPAEAHEAIAQIPCLVLDCSWHDHLRAQRHASQLCEQFSTQISHARRARTAAPAGCSPQAAGSNARRPAARRLCARFACQRRLFAARPRCDPSAPPVPLWWPPRDTGQRLSPHTETPKRS